MTIDDCSSLFATICHCSPLFALFKTIRTIRDYSLFAICDYSPFAIRVFQKLEEKLQAILTKLEKLVAIKTSIKILQEKLAGMDLGIQSLAIAQASAYHDINDLKDSESFYEFKQQTSL